MGPSFCCSLCLGQTGLDTWKGRWGQLTGEPRGIPTGRGACLREAGPGHGSLAGHSGDPALGSEYDEPLLQCLQGFNSFACLHDCGPGVGLSPHHSCLLLTLRWGFTSKVRESELDANVRPHRDGSHPRDVVLRAQHRLLSDLRLSRKIRDSCSIPGSLRVRSDVCNPFEDTVLVLRSSEISVRLGLLFSGRFLNMDGKGAHFQGLQRLLLQLEGELLFPLALSLRGWLCRLSNVGLS